MKRAWWGGGGGEGGGAIAYTKEYSVKEGLEECRHSESCRLLGVARAAGNETIRSHAWCASLRILALNLEGDG